MVERNECNSLYIYFFNLMGITIPARCLGRRRSRVFGRHSKNTRKLFACLHAFPFNPYFFACVCLLESIEIFEWFGIELTRYWPKKELKFWCKKYRPIKRTAIACNLQFESLFFFPRSIDTSMDCAESGVGYHIYSFFWNIFSFLLSFLS